MHSTAWERTYTQESSKAASSECEQEGRTNNRKSNLIVSAAYCFENQNCNRQTDKGLIWTHDIIHLSFSPKGNYLLTKCVSLLFRAEWQNAETTSLFISHTCLGKISVLYPQVIFTHQSIRPPPIHALSTRTSNHPPTIHPSNQLFTHPSICPFAQPTSQPAGQTLHQQVLMHQVL